MILLALGANLPGLAGPPLAQCEAALAALESRGVRIAGRSRWWDTPPHPPSGQPHFVNGVVRVETRLGPVALLAEMHAVEAALGRRRSVPNAARSLDLDLLDYEGQVRTGPEPPILPHPRMTERSFVLLPLQDVAPEWRHPVSGLGVAALIGALPPGHGARPLDMAGAGGDQRPGKP
jgi:2-amino-4-hydroxy-6-hydroxymethyldihydropteridine diphosphokinase